MAEQNIGGAKMEVGADVTGFTEGMAHAGAAAKAFDRTLDKTADSVDTSLNQVGKAGETAANKLDAQAKRMISTINRLGRQAGLSQGEFLANEAQRLGIAGQPGVAESIRKIKDSEKVVGNLGMTVKQTAQAMRLLPAQITDIVTSLVSGQPAYLVAIQQGGQLKDMFGGIGGAAKALLTVFTPLRLAIGGAIGAVGYLAAAFVGGMNESEKFGRALTMSGNFAGTSMVQFREMQQEIARVAGSQGDAARAMTQLAQTGQVSARSFVAVSTAAIQLERTAGVALEKTIEQFVKLGDEPSKASAKLNEQYNYLTVSVYEQIRALEKSGQQSAAAELAMKTFADTVSSRAKTMQEDMGYFNKRWFELLDVINKVKSALGNLGRPDLDPSSKVLGEARAQLQKLEEQRANMPKQGAMTRMVPQLDAAIERQKTLVEQLVLAERSEARRLDYLRQDADVGKKLIARSEAEVQFAKEFATNRQKAAAAIKEWETALGRKLTATELAQINAKFKDPKGPATKDDAATKMLNELREAERVLDREIEQRQELNGYAQKALEFEQQITNIAAKRAKNWTDEDKSLFANQDAIRARLQVLAVKEREKDLQEVIAAAENRQNDRNIEAANKLMALREQLASAQASRDENNQRTLGISGMSDRAEDELKERRALVREYERMQVALNKATKPSELGTKEHLAEQQAINDALAVAIQRQEQFNATRQMQRESGAFGQSKAFANYVDNAMNLSRQVEDAWGNAFQGIEDVFSNFATTGKLEFQDLADSIISDISRILIRAMIMKAILGMTGGSADAGAGSNGLVELGTGTYYPGRAKGGPVSSMTPYMVGERGPELFVPNTGGRIVPNGAMGGMTVVQHITIQGGTGQTTPERDQLQRLMRDSVRAGLVEAKTRNSAVTE